MNPDTAAPPLRLLQIDDAVAGMPDAPSSGCSVVHVTGAADARRALALQQFDLIVLDPGAMGEAASVVLLDTLPQINVRTPVLLLCGYLPSEACRDRANLCLLKESTAAPALWAMIRALVDKRAGAGPWGTP